MDYSLAPMLATAKKSIEQVNPELYACERKWDGWRLVIWITPEGNVKVYGGRNGSDYSGQLPYLETSLAASLPSDTVLDGEITRADGFGAVSGVMRRNDPHIPTEFNPALVYQLFDITRIAGKDTRRMSWEARRMFVETIQGVEHINVPRLLETSQKAVDEVLAAGGEGVVLKRRSSSYINSRSQDWIKIKAELTAECRVVGFKPGTPGSSWEGLVGAIEFELVETGVRSRCSGFDMALREAMTENPQAYQGRIFEMKFNPGVGSDGLPRHPNFLRWRPERDLVGNNGGKDGPQLTGKASQKAKGTTGMAGSSGHTSTREQTYKMRNYGAMKLENLERCKTELETGIGDAFDRCVFKGGDPEADLVKVNEVLAQKLEATTEGR